MKEVKVSLITPSFPLIGRIIDEDDIRYLEVDDNSLATMVMSKVNQGTQLEIYINGDNDGHYIYIAKSDGMILFAKGDIEKIMRK
ncbi:MULTISPECIES: hypothetical protein [Hafniaceae]|uniref:Uncharacterized protein n=1 Tax=Hafnia alvei TaxID=569 RepID=A0ABD7Q2D4_HAFAL|nr:MULTISPECIES: hypothetical protein [Hafniaceae]TBL66648.1 hypothetical protein EYY96_16885 [Hafnia alvei]TBL73837.1 hypothetical protein EYY94_15975 [Obesumbacterium proteus]